MKVISLFSGAGGMDLGFKNAGFELVWAIDNFSDAVETYRRNLDSPILLSDIREVDSSEIPDADVAIGGFPCQGFSIANMTRSETDGRNQLYLEFVRVLKHKAPRFFVAENVKGILSLGKGAVFSQILEDFSKAGYRVLHQVLDAADYGVPQRRKRVFLVGIRDGLEVDYSAFPPPPTHAPPGRATLLGLSKWASVGKALKGIPEPSEPHSLTNHDYSKYKLRFNGYLGHRRIDPAAPCPTITARGDERGGVVIHHHPGNHRRLSARETALLQSFPLDFEFAGCKTSVYRQVANAVPPRLAERVAAALKQMAQKKLEHALPAPRKAVS